MNKFSIGFRYHCTNTGELFDYVVQKGTLTEEEAAAIVKQVTSALVYIHQKGIVHRDLKPEVRQLLLPQDLHLTTFFVAAEPTTDSKATA